MQILYTQEFHSSLQNISSTHIVRASRFFQAVEKHLNTVAGPLFFQTLPYTIKMESTNALAKALKTKVPLDPDVVVFSLTDKEFLILFAVNINNQNRLEMWFIKRL